MSTVAESNGQALAVLSSGERPWPTGRRPVDRAAVQHGARALLVALGADLETEGLRETPRRMAAAYTELLTPEPFRPTTFPNDEGYDELVVVRDIPFESLCMHHVLPFHGVAHVGYLPADGSSASRSSRALSSCSPAIFSCKSGSRPRSPAACRRSCSRRVSAS